MSGSWTGSQIRSAASGLAKNAEVALCLDRRVDPESPLELSFADTSVAEIWRRIAESHELAVVSFGPVIYLGPKSTARDLKTLAALRRDDASRAAPALKAKLSESRPTTCEAPCESRALWTSLATEAGLRTTNLERMPFDVWPAVDWAPLPLVDRLTLLAVQFDLTFKLDATARTLTFEPLPSSILIERSYPAGLKPQETLARFRALAPLATVRLAGAKIAVVGKVEDHELVSGTGSSAVANTAATSPAVPAAAKQLFTLRVKDVPLDELIRVLQEKHKLKIRVDEAAIKAAGLTLDRRTEVDVAKATLEELLEQAAAPLGLTARRDGETVEIGVRAAAPK
ncbi:MAG: hypothetical protein K8U03_08705 [Planctomycetia bacterium]|nr:hypothetical protein [Planctomycetia bacterium]